MIFSSLEYVLFLPVVVFLYWKLRGFGRLLLVVFSSFFFYMSWLPAYGLLLLVLSAATWGLGQGIAASPSKSAFSKVLLGLGFLLNLGCLCYYKYAGFFLENLASSLDLLRSSSLFGYVIPAWDAPVIEALLPLGISFFVFEFIHYLVDVYKGNKPISSWWEFAAFASYFPSQIAGPIKRYQDFAQKLRAPESLNPSCFYEAMGLIVQGLFKKIAIADPIGSVIFPTFTATSGVSCGDALIASIGFVVQVYCDFSGYTDIGRGSSLLLGIRLPENFQLPYLAQDLAEFWRRWHISLSSWLRDYIYIPLGGSKSGKFGTWRNLFITMFACGLWHGASWHYVIFGCLQGLGLIVQREWQTLLGNEGKVATGFNRWLGIFLTMAFITLTFVVFRAPDMPHAFAVLAGYFNFAGECTLAIPLVKSGALVFLSLYFAFWCCMEKLPFSPLLAEFRERSYLAVPLRISAWTAALLLMLAATPTEAVPFVYFQF